MSDLRELLEDRRRAHRPEDGAFDRLARRRARSQRNQRIAAAVVVLIVLAGAAWGAIALRESTRPRPAGPPVSSLNVSKLRLAWSGSIGGLAAPATPVAGNGVIYVAADRLYTFSSACHGTRCGPSSVWAPPQWPTVSRPAVASDLVFVSAGSLYALPAECLVEPGPCEPAWMAPRRSGDMTGYSAPAVAGGVVYVNSSLGPYGFPVNCGSGGRECSPVWHGVEPGGFSSPAIEGGRVFVNGQERLSAYPVACQPDPLVCRPLWSTPHGGALSSPVVGDGMVFVHHEASTLYAFRQDCRSDGGTCAQSWSWSGPFDGNPSDGAVSRGMVYIAGPDGRLFAFLSDCGGQEGTCDPLWSVSSQASPRFVAQASAPVVADDLVFVYRDRLSAFPATCSGRAGDCRALWTSDVLAGQSHLTSPLVTDQAVYAVSPSGVVYAFTVVDR
jgi:outer membrane protein assembly factor BamB